MKPNFIRPIAICVFRHNGRILAAEGYDPLNQQKFYRPLGGAIEFGEHSAVTIGRELAEELGAAVVDLRFLGAIENVFTYDGQVGPLGQFYESVRWDDPTFERRLDVKIPAGGGIQWTCDFEAPAGECGDPEDGCCYTFGGRVEAQEHCNAFVYYYPLGQSSINCF